MVLARSLIAKREVTPAAAQVRLAGLSVDYATRRGTLRAVENIDLSIAAGEFVAVLGPSGCGKSTLLRVLAGLLAPSAGTAEIAGTPVTGPRRDVGVVFQDPTLLPWKTAFENLCLPGRIMRLDRSVYLMRAQELLKLVGLEAFGDYYPHQLSGGMRQRVGIARGLLHDPALLLMDEPFGALDAMTREAMNLEIQRIWAATRKSVFFITHSIPEAVFLADRVVVMSARPGRVVEILDNDLPRPRGIGVMATPEFGERTARLRRYFRVEGGVD
jgi:NitT/TauT family transport system ATP-binding protein